MAWKSLLALGILLAGFSPAGAAFGLRADGSLDQKALRESYTDGDFDKVKAALETARKRSGRKPSREDGIFTDKYLGVIYAADSATFTRAESHFNMLFEAAPNIELADMYVSNRVQAFFERVKTDFQKNKNYNARFDQFGNPLSPKTGKAAPEKTAAREPVREDRSPAPPVKPDKKEKSAALEKKGSSGKWIWITLATATVGVGTGYYLMTRKKPEPPGDKVTVVQGKPD